MPMPFTFTEEDIKGAELLEPGKYICDVVKVEQQMSKDKTSFSAKITLKTSSGVPLFHWISEKGLMIPINQEYFRAFIKGQPLTPGMQVDPEQTQGRKVGVNVIRGSYNNKPKNQVDGFFPAPE